MRLADWATNLLGVDPMGRGAGTELGSRRLSLVAAIVAIALVLYLPLEPAMLGPLSGPSYWAVRLLPDAVIALLAAAVLWVDRRSYGNPHRIILVMAAIAIAITVSTVARGQAASDAVNALRVLLRYPLLGLILWRSVGDLPTLSRRLIQVIILAGAIQVVIGLVMVTRTTIETGVWTDSYFLAGTVGRYDRYGPLLASMIVAMLTWSMATRWRAWFWPLLLAAAPLLYLSTSRQGMVGLVVAGVVAAILPRVTGRVRLLSAGIAVVAVAMILVTPTAIAAPSGGGDEPPPTVIATVPPTGVVPGASPPTVIATVPPTGMVPGASPTVMATVPPTGMVPGASPPQPSSGSGKPILKGNLALSAEPGRNFRLYLLLTLMPWAAQQEPLIGFGPGQHVAPVPDPRLEQFVAQSDLEWSDIVGYMNDSQYTSLVIQFGLLATMAFMALLLGSLAIVARGALVSIEPLVRYSLLFGLMALVDATLGPFFEVRTDSILLWAPLLVSVGTLRGVRAGSASRRPGAITT